MMGTVINAAAILGGGTLGLVWARSISPAYQNLLKNLLGILTVYVGVSMTWSGLNGSLPQIAKQLVIVVLALMLGRLAGRLLRLQQLSNRLGQYASRTFAGVQPQDSGRAGQGFITCSLLFCVGPMAILGALQDGLLGSCRTLAIKSVMDGLATMAFAQTFGWGVLLSALPVLAYQGTLTLGAQWLEPILHQQSLLDSISATGGLLIFCLSMLIWGWKRIGVADYLPSLLVAPLLTWLWR
jgi:uncharacterized protein